MWKANTIGIKNPTISSMFAIMFPILQALFAQRSSFFVDSSSLTALGGFLFVRFPRLGLLSERLGGTAVAREVVECVGARCGRDRRDPAEDDENKGSKTG